MFVRTLLLLLTAGLIAGAQPPALSPPRFAAAVSAFVKFDAPVVALRNVRVIDGTGAPAR